MLIALQEAHSTQSYLTFGVLIDDDGDMLVPHADGLCTRTISHSKREGAAPVARSRTWVQLWVSHIGSQCVEPVGARRRRHVWSPCGKECREDNKQQQQYTVEWLSRMDRAKYQNDTTKMEEKRGDCIALH